MSKAAQRVGRHDDKLISNGGRVISKVRLTPTINANLKKIMAETGESATAIINRLISDYSNRED